MSYRVIDLFSGAGGLSLGFCDERFGGGFRSILALDNDQAAIETFNTNFGKHGICGDINDFVAAGEIPAADVVIGGPPCQGFSLLNKNRAGDERRGLWQPFMEVVQTSGARVFLIENVRWLHSSPEFEEIRVRAHNLGFDVYADVLHAADYGAPQSRYRVVILGVHRDLDTTVEFPPLPTHAAPDDASNLPRWRTVRDAIGDLPSPSGTELRMDVSPPLDLHFGRNPTALSIERYKQVPPGGNRFDLQRNAPELTPQCWIRKKTGGTDLFGRLWWDRPSVTIRTEFFKPEKGRYLHPIENRPITHREAARMMGFPDDFRFKGSKVEIARQIGNAVPPPFAGALSVAVRGLIDRSEARAA